MHPSSRLSAAARALAAPAIGATATPAEPVRPQANSLDGGITWTDQRLAPELIEPSDQASLPGERLTERASPGVNGGGVRMSPCSVNAASATAVPPLPPDLPTPNPLAA